MKYTYQVQLRLRDGLLKLDPFTSECPVDTGHILSVRMDVINWLCGLQLRVTKVVHHTNLIKRHNDPDITILKTDFVNESIRDYFEEHGEETIVGSFTSHDWVYKKDS